MMRNIQSVLQPLLPLCAALLLAGCGGGSTVDADASESAAAADDDRVTAQAAAGPGALRLASSNVAGRPGDLGGAPCGISRDGNLVAMVSSSSNLGAVGSPYEPDIFLKNLQTGVVTLVNTTASGALMRGGAFLACHAMTPDGTWVIFSSDFGGTSEPYGGGAPPEVALLAKNTRTGAVLRVTPPLQSVPNAVRYTFHSVTDSGSHVVFTAQPATRYLGPYSYVATGPARLMVYERAGGTVRDLSAIARLDVSGSPEASANTAALSPEGDRIAFTSRLDHPEAGDRNGKSDVFVLDLASGNLVLASTDADGLQSVFAGGFASPPRTVFRFSADGRELIYGVGHDSSIGPAGVYAKDLVDQGLRLLLAEGSGVDVLSALAFDESASRALLVRRTAGGSGFSYLRDLSTGSEQRIDTTAAGTVGNGQSVRGVLSAGGDHVAFQTDATNLVSLPRRTFRWQTYAKNLVAAAAQ
jgi:hypothetical protein